MRSDCNLSLPDLMLAYDYQDNGEQSRKREKQRKGEGEVEWLNLVIHIYL